MPVREGEGEGGGRRGRGGRKGRGREKGGGRKGRGGGRGRREGGDEISAGKRHLQTRGVAGSETPH